MSSTTMVHLPQPSDPHPLAVRSDIQASGTASLTLKVLADFDLHIFTDDPRHLRRIATVAAELADRLESAQVVASYAKPVTA